jgi:GTPase SAR1 family protein
MMLLSSALVTKVGKRALITCANCGVGNPADATFCSACSHFLAWEAAPGKPTPSPPPLPVTAEPDLSKPAAPLEPAPVDSSVRADEADPREAGAEVTPLPALTDPLDVALSTVHAAHRLATEHSREDLAAHLNRAEERITQREISVAVVGEFKRGKSTLVNALLQTAVCPVDADIVTMVPTIVSYGAIPEATAIIEPNKDGAPPSREPVPLDDLAEFVSEMGNSRNRRRVRTVEVKVPHRLLRSGLRLIDTPGVGGLDSAHGVVTLSELGQAQGMIFLTDASQELTGPELEFLQAALKRCPMAVCVVTKTDLYMEWRRIVELTSAHLRAAGIDIPVVPVSSFLRLGSRENHELLAESGFPALVDFILGTIVPAENDRTIELAAQEVEFVAAQLEDELQVEQHVLASPEQAQQVVERLDEAKQKTRQLASPTATWQQMLTDGIQDLVAEVEFDLQERLRGVMRDAETIIDEGDPKHTWPDIEVWLRRQAVAAAVDNYDRMNTLATELAESVAATFDLIAGQVSSAQPITRTDSVEQIQVGGGLQNQAGRLASMLLAGRTATLVPMLLVGTLGHLLLPVIAPLALVLAGGIGQKVIRDERKRQVTFRRQQAKQAARKYVDEVAFMIGKDSRDALRGTQRNLRDDFQSRALALARSAESTLGSVQAAMILTPHERVARAAQVARDSAEVRNVRRNNSSRTPVAVA